MCCVVGANEDTRGDLEARLKQRRYLSIGCSGLNAGRGAGDSGLRALGILKDTEMKDTNEILIRGRQLLLSRVHEVYLLELAVSVPVRLTKHAFPIP